MTDVTTTPAVPTEAVSTPAVPTEAAPVPTIELLGQSESGACCGADGCCGA
ncbi:MULTISPECIES: hypothetical protein [Cryobacterium]|uniref:hypothetical protein n=1 Tax=Cryobacterium TaxID=69578 RepID=UPI001356C075|nr:MULTISPECIES: hypothetical protein [Cryobacterium]